MQNFTSRVTGKAPAETGKVRKSHVPKPTTRGGAPLRNRPGLQRAIRVGGLAFSIR